MDLTTEQVEHFERVKKRYGPRRTFEQIKEHYLIEKVLAARLRAAPRSERQHLYNEVYDELYTRVEHHPTHRGTSKEVRNQSAERRVKMLKRFLKPDHTYMEVGPGSCAVILKVARLVKKAYAVDVTSEGVKGLETPPNFELALSDGSSIPVPPGSINVAFSDQVMEHLHPDDALEQLRNIHTALAPGGVYVCITPNRLTGPHDVSKYFDDVATCFHLKEYTNAELVDVFKQAGFSKVRVLIGAREFRLPVPVRPIKWFENTIDALPHDLGARVAHTAPAKILNTSNVALLATK